MRAFTFLLLTALILASCKSGPKYQRPPVKTPEKFSNAQEKLPFKKLTLWWEAFDDKRLNALVLQLYKQNLTRREAIGRVGQHFFKVFEARGERASTLGLEFNAQKFQMPNNKVLPRAILGDRTKNLHGLGLVVGYELDFFGRMAHKADEVWFTYLASEEDLKLVSLMLIGQMVDTYFEVARHQALFELNQEEKKALQELNKAQNFSGYAEAKYKLLLAQTTARLPEIRNTRQNHQQHLKFLIGQYPGGGIGDMGTKILDTKLDPLPPGLPSDLLKRRPDIRKAELLLKASNEHVGVRHAELFPRIGLTGSLGYSSSQLGSLVSGQTLGWQFGGSIFQALNDGGRNQARKQQALALYQEHTAKYLNTVHQAFLEVEQLLTNQKYLKQQQLAHQAVLRAAKDAQNKAKEHDDKLAALQTNFATQRHLIDLKAKVLHNRVALIKALGGGLPPALPETPAKDGSEEAHSEGAPDCAH